MEKLRNTKILGVLGNILVLIALFCPWATVEATSVGLSESAQFISGTDGQAALFLSIISLIIIFAENISAKFFKGLTNVKLTYITTVIQLLMIVNILSKKFTMQYPDDITVHFQLGFYLMCIGIILLLAFPIVYNQKANSN